MNWEIFKKKFHHSWHPHMKEFIESPACDEIFKLLKSRSAEGEIIAPTSHNTFKAFEIPLDSIKVIIMGDRPYDDFINGIPIANGRYLDCANIEAPSNELKNFYRGLELEIYNGLKLDHYPTTNSVNYLIEQGVMMMTSELTTEAYGNHNNLWTPFIEFIITKVLDNLDVPIVFIGDSKDFTHLIKDTTKVFALEAPQGVISKWDTKGVFQKIDNFLENKNQETIMWLNVECPF